MGCNGHNDPVSADSSDTMMRFAQEFNDIYEWPDDYDAYSIDSSTATWTYPVPGSYTIGDIVMGDSPEVPAGRFPVTAIVRHENDEPDSTIGIRIYESGNSLVHTESFSYADKSGDVHIDQDYQDCRNPAVEVTYNREQGVDIAFKVHIVWSERISYGELYSQWEIVYRYIEFGLDDSREWEKVRDDYVKVSCLYRHNEQPDLCVYRPTGDLYAVFRNIVDPYSTIYATRLPASEPWDPDGWESPDLVSSSHAAEHPSIDAGCFTEVTPETGITAAGQIIAVWSQDEVYDEIYYYPVIYLNDWSPVGSPDSGDAVAISENEWGTDAVLPRVEVLPYSSDLNEAVIVWDERPSIGCVGPNVVAMAVTPFIGPEYSDYCYEVDVDYMQRPDLAAYEGAHSGFEDMGLFALASQCNHDGLTNDWDIVAAAFSVEVDDQTEEFNFIREQITPIQCVPERSTIEEFTGPSISIRDTSISGWMYDEFAVAYIVEDFNSYIAFGDTTE